MDRIPYKIKYPKFLILLIVCNYFFSCAYFNTFYNAETSYKKALKIIDNLYSSILVGTKTFPVDSIEIAEAAKVIENAQRDLNIAFVN